MSGTCWDSGDTAADPASKSSCLTFCKQNRKIAHFRVAGGMKERKQREGMLTQGRARSEGSGKTPVTLRCAQNDKKLAWQSWGIYSILDGGGAKCKGPKAGTHVVVRATRGQCGWGRKVSGEALPTRSHPA